MVFCSFPGFTDKSGDTAQPRILAAIVLCMFYSFTYTLICLGKKQISDMTSVWFFFFPGDLTVHFFLGRARVSFKSFSPGFLRTWNSSPAVLSLTHYCFSPGNTQCSLASHPTGAEQAETVLRPLRARCTKVRSQWGQVKSHLMPIFCRPGVWVRPTERGMLSAFALFFWASA